MSDRSALLRCSPCNSHPTFSRLSEPWAFPSFLAGCVSRAGWVRAFLKRSNHPASWRLGEEGFPRPASCCRGRCQITLIPALKPACTGPASHRSPILQRHFSGPHPAQTLNLRQHFAVPPGFASNRTCAQQLPPAGCRQPRARWDNGGSSPPGSPRAFAAQHSRAGSWRKSEELVRENLGKGKGKKILGPGKFLRKFP